jgi:hypothetical protein
MVLAVHNYASTSSGGALPPYASYVYTYSANWKFSYVQNSFFFSLLPYIEQNTIYNAANVNGTCNSNLVAADVVKTYISPLDFTVPPNGQIGVAEYSYNVFKYESVIQAAVSYTVNSSGLSYSYSETYPGGNYNDTYPVSFAEYTDGTSNTMLMSETLAACGLNFYSQWYPQWDPADLYNVSWAKGATFYGYYYQYDWNGSVYTYGEPNAFFNLSGAACNRYYSYPMPSGNPASGRSDILIGLADGSVRPITTGTSQATIWKLACINDGNPLGDDF